MEAFLLAAGLGTRLRPLTNNKPKALVEANGVPLLEIALRNLASQGATRIVVNVHHFAQQIVDYIQEHRWDAEVIISDESNLLMDTGGGLKKAQHLFSGNRPILIHNVDILSRINFQNIIEKHLANNNLATLAVSGRATSRQLLFDSEERLVGWHNRSSDEFKWAQGTISNFKELAFSGIAVISPQLLEMLPPANAPYPIIPAYLELAKVHTISAFEHNPNDWLDVGKPETLSMAQKFL